MQERMLNELEQRRQEGSLRSWVPLVELSNDKPDFSSNDYLGLARCPHQRRLVQDAYQALMQTESSVLLGATGSRLLSGDSRLVRQLEESLARIHRRPAALVCNSGYDANLSVLSSVPSHNDIVILDELCHNSLVMGLRMSRCQQTQRFRHNDVKDLRQCLQQNAKKGRSILVVVESVYSMDGDVAPLREILTVAHEFRAQVVVDEAHGLGLYGITNVSELGLVSEEAPALACAADPTKSSGGGGTGVLGALQLESHPALLCSIHTFGKAAGAHGAVICGSTLLQSYLLNYARPLIYSTALPAHALVTIQCAYQTLLSEEGESKRTHVFEMVKLFRQLLQDSLVLYHHTNSSSAAAVSLWPSHSPIQALVVLGNNRCVEVCQSLKRRCGIVLYPIRAPTVPRGTERVRIILHAHNTPVQVRQLVHHLVETLRDMGLLEQGGAARL